MVILLCCFALCAGAETPAGVQGQSESIEKRLLARAEQALARGHLTTPLHNNAYDAFKSVLIINPQNSSARAGLNAILLRYVDMHRQAVKNAQSGAAAKLLRLVEERFPGSPLLAQMRRERREMRRVTEAMLKQPQPAAEDKSLEYRLPRRALGRKSSGIRLYLASVGRRVRNTGESVLIHARSDAEGRWIYRQMNDAVPDYRIRGDIRVSRQTKISLLPPLQ